MVILRDKTAKEPTLNLPHLTLRQLQVFVAVARGGSTSAAAGQVALSQSATSAALNELERLLGVRLFDRRGRRLALNEDGRSLLPRAAALLDGAQEIGRQAGEEQGALQELRIGSSTTIANYVLPRLLRRLLEDAQARPGRPWSSRVAIGNVESVCEQVANFELDIGFVEGTWSHPALELVPWLRDEMLVVGAPVALAGHPSGATVPLRTLRAALWLLREAGSGTRQSADQMLLPHLGSYRRSIELASSEAIKRAAAEGVGLACLSRWVVQDLVDSGALQVLRSTLPRHFRQCYYVLNRSKHPTRALHRLLRVALDEARSSALPAAPRPRRT